MSSSELACSPVAEALPVNSVATPTLSLAAPSSRWNRPAELSSHPGGGGCFLFQAWKRTLLWQHASTHGRRPEGRGGCFRGGGRPPERLQRNQGDGVTQILSS